ncbi:MAG: DNA-3-methyladenine glycosylase [Cyanobacteria bacterium NC_groundwater_1444_Ag_S-0.65um_54_12]|nr:DNA-3-methyladenine glycosylase [Cyanobacteria bacterium NC_groundwater_1444_Ag_S-0.65um_54_12]
MASFVRIAAASLEGDACAVACRLLGARLVRVTEQGVRSGFIVETEAYRQGDPASHSCRGTTPRNHSMFERPGIAYVYFTYGNHFCLNVVCEPPGIGAAVLLRALEPELGKAEMASARGGRERDLTNGPGRLCQALSIDRTLDGTDLLSSDELFLAAGPVIPQDAIVATTRIGISQGQDRPWRFLLPANPWVSRPLPQGGGRLGTNPGTTATASP